MRDVVNLDPAAVAVATGRADRDRVRHAAVAQVAPEVCVATVTIARSAGAP